MSQNLVCGARGQARRTVDATATARSVGSGSLDVLATPMLIAIMEEASMACVQAQLGEGSTTVGIAIDAKHTAASPVGAIVEAISELLAVEGRILKFRIEARDDNGPIGSALHTRAIVDSARFMSGVAQRRATDR